MPRTSVKRGLLAVSHEPSPAASIQDTPEVLSAKHTLRTHWKWAYISHFLYVFEPMLNLAEHVSTTDLENDLAAGTTAFIPRVIIRMLTCLTHDRKITNENYQSVIYKQYIRRAPESLPALVTRSSVDRPKSRAPSPSQTGEDQDEKEGTPEDDDPVDGLDAVEKVEWVLLTLEQKLDVLYDLCEWHFQNPTRLRSNMKFDDEWASWRIEPTGYDASHNLYFLLAGDRLWIQRVPPRKPRKSSKKSKDIAPKKAGKKKLHAKPVPQMSNPKKRPATPEVSEISTRASKRIKQAVETSTSANGKRASTSGRPSRAAAADANRKLAALPKTTMTSRGMRASARLGAREDEVWQEIPEEWLRPAAGSSYSAKETSPGVEEDEEKPKSEPEGTVSDLTELSELSELSEIEEGSDEQEGNAGEKDTPKWDSGRELLFPAGVVEWENIVVTLRDWETFPRQFEKSTNYLEKAFYKLLVKEGGIVQSIVEDLRAAVRKQQQEEAITHRKRSSRLAIKEIEKEEARLRAIKESEENEKFDRARRAEARARKEEESRKLREEKREERRRAAEEASVVDVVEEELPCQSQIQQAARKLKTVPKTKSRPVTPIRRANGAHHNPSTPGGAEDWELDCELCGTRGMNVNDGNEITCCESCGKWQHVWCWNQQDKREGLPPRNWVAVEFRCRDCKRAWRARPAASTGNGRTNSTSTSSTLHPVNYQATQAAASSTAVEWQKALQYPHSYNYQRSQNAPISATAASVLSRMQHSSSALPQTSQPPNGPSAAYQNRISFTPNLNTENYNAVSTKLPTLPSISHMSNGLPPLHRGQSNSMIAATYGPQPIGSSYYRPRPSITQQFQRNGLPHYSAGIQENQQRPVTVYSASGYQPPTASSLTRENSSASHRSNDNSQTQINGRQHNHSHSPAPARPLSPPTSPHVGSSPKS